MTRDRPRFGAFGLAALIGAALLLSPGLAHATVRVSVVDPGRFRDADRAGGVLTVADTLRSLAAYLQHLGGRLPPGQDLRIEILDLNLAGVTNPFNPSAQTTRFLNGTTWPSIRLRYRLTEGSRVILAGEELVADREYLARPTVSFAEDPLRFEKNMLYDWFDARFILRWPAPPRA